MFKPFAQNICVGIRLIRVLPYSSIVARGWPFSCDLESVATKFGYKEFGVSSTETSVSCNYKVKELIQSSK